MSLFFNFNDLEKEFDKMLGVDQKIKKAEQPLNFVDHNTLGEVLDVTFGRSSDIGYGRFVTSKIIGGNNVQLQYSAPITFHDKNEENQLVRKESDDSEAVLKSKIKDIEANFKEKSGKKIKLSIVSNRDSLEISHVQQYISAKRSAFYRRFMVLDIKETK